jgi:hypothetical protein
MAFEGGYFGEEGGVGLGVVVELFMVGHDVA